MPRFLHSHYHLGLQYSLLVFLVFLLIQPVFAQQADSATPTIVASSVAPAPSPDAENPKAADLKVVDAKAPYYSANSNNNKVGSGSHIMSVTFALLFIVALIVAVSWFIRRFGSGVFASTSHMKIIASMPLGTRERIMLVDVGGQHLLLGVTAAQINTLHVFSEPVEIGTPTAPVSDFSQKLMALLQQKNNPSDATNNNNSQGQG